MNLVFLLYFIRSINHDMYLQLVQKSTQTVLDDKGCYIIEFESKPWK